MEEEPSVFTVEELGELAKADQLVVAVMGRVYNVTEFSKSHPGGSSVFRRYNGMLKAPHHILKIKG
jgi:cytochrome b involved in lipid metabolism